jgi:hypothetical protein
MHSRTPRTKRLAAAIVCATVACIASPLQQGTVWNFDNEPAGRSPSGFTFAGAAGTPAPWVVLRDGPASVLSHVPGSSAEAHFAVVESTPLTNLAMSVRLRFANGAGSAGLVWRYRNPTNYYLAALNLAAHDIRIYRVAGGNRTRLQEEDDLELEPATWHSMKIEHTGMRMRLWINGVPTADARDRVSQDEGGFGLWTSSDSVVWFDDLHAMPLVERPRDNRRD